MSDHLTAPSDCCSAEAKTESALARMLKTYYPLILIFSYLAGGVLFSEALQESFLWMRAMAHFMGAFFVVFSFFKLLDLRAFADAYRTYDVVAKAFPLYGFAYPFIELCLGLGFFMQGESKLLNVISLIVMSVSSVGVMISLARKQQILCACLGTVFNLPMSKVTLIEDLLMVCMSLIMLYSA